MAGKFGNNVHSLRGVFEKKYANKDLASILSLIHYLSSCTTIEAVMASVTETARSLLHVDGVTFILRDRGKCYYADEDAIAPLWRGQRFPMEACISGWCMIHREAVAVEDIYQDPRIPTDAYRPTFVRSLVMAPVRSIDPIAAIGAYWGEQRSFTPDDLERQQAIADAAALAIANLELRQTQETLQQALEKISAMDAEKDLLLHEVHHRIRNDFQIVLTLLQMARTSQHGSVEEVVETTTERIAILSRVYGRLRRDGTARLVDTRSFVEGLVEDLGLAMTGLRPLAVEVYAEAADVGVSTSVALGLIINELVTNALKYAFPDNRPGRLVVTFRRDGDAYVLTVVDNGIGMTSDTPKGTGLGGQLVQQFAQQLGGTLEIRNRQPSGVQAVLRFPVAEAQA
ncbi:MAG TPA: ATP-binding protein [Azospirillum sp.]|nr:ATP-binding protein [Azospirillum sp.]